jgi:hypothetical protein
VLVKPLLIFPPYGLRVFSPFFQVFVYFLTILQIVTEDRVNIRQRQGRILLCDLFRCRSPRKCSYDCIQRDPRPTDPRDTILAKRQREGKRLNLQGSCHEIILPEIGEDFQSLTLFYLGCKDVAIGC